MERNGRSSVRHLSWIPATALVGFLTAFILGDLLTLPVDLYYLLYFISITCFAAYYARLTRLDLRQAMSRRLLESIVLGLLGGVVLAQGVLGRPDTARLSGAFFWWALFWRGAIYGLVDGVLLFSVPWVVAWRALDAERAGVSRRMAAGGVAYIGILLVTTAYHLGYRDFRSSKIVQPNIGSTIAAVPTLLSANPAGSPISHVFLHVAAVIHSPHTDLFLPPHRE